MKLIEEGTLPKSLLDKLGNVSTVQGTYDVPVTVVKSRPASEMIFQYNGKPVPRMSPTEAWARLGTSKVSLGRAKWSADGASIFSVADGKKLAQTPPKLPTQWELNRQRKIAQAAVDSRVVSGIRLMPEYTPARAMLWGTIIALWGTGAIFTSAARGLDIHNAEEASGKLQSALQPVIDMSSRTFAPLKDWFKEQNAHESVTGQLLPVNELARRMRSKLGHEHHS